MKDWQEIKDDKDIETLLHLYGNFHDSCLREVHIVTRESVDGNLTMLFNGILTVTLLFQRQYKDPTVIEVKFDNMTQFNFNPSEPNYNSIILNATFKRVDNLFYWASEENWNVGDNDAVWVSGQKAYWRERPELIGQVNRINN